jgi:hypothetical protein
MVTAVVVVVLVVWPTQGHQRPATAAAGGRQASAPAVGAGEAAPPAASARAAIPGPARTRDAAGARAAGVAMVEFNEQLVALDDQAALDARRAMSASGAADALVEQLRAKLAQLRQGWPKGTLTYRVAPLAVRASTDGADAFKVDVWYVGVVAGRTIPTYEEWNTESYRLVWERDDWRMASLATTPGPRPDPTRQPQASSAEIDARLAGFESVR